MFKHDNAFDNKSTNSSIHIDSIAYYIKDRRFFYLALLRIEHLGPLSYQKCLQVFDEPEQVFQASEADLQALGLKKKSIKGCREFAAAFAAGGHTLYEHIVFQGVKADIEWAQQASQHIILIHDKDYPEQLKEIYDYPAVLFVIGNPSLLSSLQLAMVGSRRPSKAGMLDAKSFAKSLASQGLIVCSGLANGIDAFAHEGALEAGNGFTLAVLAHGLDSIYPKRNRHLAARIINKGGALVSEFPTGVQPRPEYFPRRNRIISGLSKGVLVVEAAIKSGSLVTAYSALEQNREVFAIPGSIHNPVAKGCHQLIKQGAKLVECIQDILDELPDFSVNPETKMLDGQNSLVNSLDKIQQSVFYMIGHNEVSANDIANMSKLEMTQVSTALTMLELKKLIIQGEHGYIRNPYQ